MIHADIISHGMTFDTNMTLRPSYVTPEIGVCSEVPSRLNDSKARVTTSGTNCQRGRTEMSDRKMPSQNFSRRKQSNQGNLLSESVSDFPRRTESDFTLQKIPSPSKGPSALKRGSFEFENLVSYRLESCDSKERARKASIEQGTQTDLKKLAIKE